MTALVAATGDRLELAVHRWRGDVDEVEWAVLAGVDDPVLDVGCGPGRVGAALAAAGRPCLGIDTSPIAVAEATGRGGSALVRSVFEHLPGEGRWGTVLLLDGSIGIGGDAVALLRRVAALLRPGGQVLVELEPPGSPTRRVPVRIVAPRQPPGPWFPWTRVGADRFGSLATAAGLGSAPVVVRGSRWFGIAAKR